MRLLRAGRAVLARETKSDLVIRRCFVRHSAQLFRPNQTLERPCFARRSAWLFGSCC